MVYELRIEGVDDVARNLTRAGTYAQQGQLQLAHEFGARMQAAVRGRATGRPGPNVITGQYLASILYRIEATPGGAMAVVYSEAPQAQRLELGFYGRDSLGRSYSQPPYSHFRPAYDEQYPHYVAAQNRLAGKIAAVGNGGAGGGGGSRGGGLLGRLGGLLGRLG